MSSAVDSAKVILAGDVGGTHARLALMQAQGESFSIVTEKIYPSHNYSKLEDIVSEFLKENKTKPDLAGIGVAGPVRDGKCVATNLPWIVDSGTLAAAWGLGRGDTRVCRRKAKGGGIFLSICPADTGT